MLSDDHAMFLDALAMALTRRGHDVLAALSDPELVPASVRTLAPDACVIDYHYALVARPDLVDAVRRADPTATLVILTGAADARLWSAFDRGLVAAVVGKGTSLATIDGAIRAAAAGEHVVAGISRPGPRQRQRHRIDMTSRELEVLQLLVAGASTDDMARGLGISANTVRTHVQHVFDKLGVHNRVQATARALQLDLAEDARAGA